MQQTCFLSWHKSSDIRWASNWYFGIFSPNWSVLGHQYFQKIACVATHSVLCTVFLALFDCWCHIKKCPTTPTTSRKQCSELYSKGPCQVCSQAMILLWCVWPGMSDAGCLPVCYARLCFAELCGMSDGGFELLYNIVDPKLEHGVPTITEYS